jgi:transcriptional regulator with XRE-family HTH domain
MKLKKWLKINNSTIKHFAAELGVSCKQVHKYIKGEAIPRYELMILIFELTNGEVTPNDFYDIILTFIIMDAEEPQIRFEGIMKLGEWLGLNNVTIEELAAKLGVSRSQVHKYIHEGAIPRYEVMHLIFNVTSGAVTPNTFYNIIMTHTVIKTARSQSEFMEAANDHD